MKQFNWYQPTQEQQKARQAWSKYCALGNLSKQQLGSDRMVCTGTCGQTFIVREMSDSGLCMTCARSVSFDRESRKEE